ncbi:hypothetical protein [Finch poxvirus]|uniref:Uncharacterized protein n=2 Tax=unclassified Avipoxvirus TaxID=336487 RepID=A0AAT9UQQ1_9POXV|nr:hypothetical protein [Finch poxvirus]UOX39137.1 hypothetical protein [Finch poxvirus]
MKKYVIDLRASVERQRNYTSHSRWFTSMSMKLLWKMTVNL